MREYFNRKERDTHLIILFMAEIVKQFKDCTALTDTEQKHLKLAEKHLRDFSESVFDRFGDAYKRKLKGTLEVNTVRVVSNYNQDKVLSHYAIEDLEKQVGEMIAFHCCDCEKSDYRACPTYDMAIACGVECKNENGCPYKW